MKKTFTIVNYGVIDSDGDVFMPGSIKINPDKKLLVLNEFKNEEILGEVIEINHTPDEIEVVAELNIDPKGLYPSIGFQIVNSRRAGDVKEITEVKLHCIGLCGSPNVDKTIKPLL